MNPLKKQYYIDKRPLPVLFLIEYKNAILLIISFILFFVGVTSKYVPKGLTIEGYQTLIIFIFAIFLWVTNIIPLAITSLAVMGLLATFRVLEGGQIYSFFGNEAIFFIIGSFIIAAGVSSAGLNERVSYFVLSKFGERPQKLVLSIFFLAAILSHIMPEHAVAALLYPILTSIAGRLELQRDSILGKFMFLALAWGSVLGGVVTFLGGARNPLAIGILQETTGEEIHFLEWMKVVAPPIYIICIAAALYMWSKVKNSKRDTHQLQKILLSNSSQLGKIRLKEVKALLILLGTIYMWIFQSHRFSIANIALISASLYFVLNVMKWEEAKTQINWGAIFMYGGAIALGKSLVETGLLTYISDKFIANMSITLTGFIVITFVISLFLTEGVSNTAVIVILLPVIIEMAVKFGFSPKLAVYIVAVPAGLAFMFPMSSPPNAIAFSSGYIRSSEAVKMGFFLKIFSTVIFLLFAVFYWSFLGLY